jgi:hypothetical protein
VSEIVSWCSWPGRDYLIVTCLPDAVFGAAGLLAAEVIGTARVGQDSNTSVDASLLDETATAS